LTKMPSLRVNTKIPLVEKSDWNGWVENEEESRTFNRWQEFGMAARNDFVDEDILDEEEDEDILKDKFLTFRLGDEVYALDISCVVEIIGIQEISHVPDLLAFIKGVINLRGRVIPVMDVRQRVNMNIKEYDNRTCVIVIDLSGSLVGLIVDRVQEVVMISEDAIEPRPTINMKIRDQFILGMGKVEGQVIIILDVNKLLRDVELKEIDETLSSSALTAIRSPT